MSALSIEAAAQYDRDAGFAGDNLITAVAIEMAESGLDPEATNTAGNFPPSRDRGIWQINSYWHAEVSDQCAFDPGCASKAAFRISGGGNFAPWTTYRNGAYKQHVAAVTAALTGNPTQEKPAVSIGWWSLRNPWNTALALDEFGDGTLDGDPAHGHSNDGCAAAGLENGAAAYEQRAPTYVNIGHIRADMIANGHWTCSGQSCLNNPRTGGATLEDINAEIPRRGYAVVATHTPTGPTDAEAIVSAQDVHDNALVHRQAVTLFFRNAEALQGNEQVPGMRHFGTVAAYGGDQDAAHGGDEHGYSKVYLLNSDIAGQHGLATGQWMRLDEVITQAEVIGWTVWGPVPKPSQPPAPVPPAPAPTPAPPSADWHKVATDAQAFLDELNAAIKQEQGEANG